MLPVSVFIRVPAPAASELCNVYSVYCMANATYIVDVHMPTHSIYSTRRTHERQLYLCVCV